MAGAEELMDALEKKNVPLAVVSNKRGDLLRREVSHLGWMSRFFALVGAQDAPADKPDPAPIHHVLRTLGMSASREIWVVGDTDIDMRAGLAAGCSAILIGPGPADPKLLDDLQPFQKFHTCDALAGFVRGLPRTISMLS
jgi:phosphoglycolate phosphatase